MDNQVDLLKAFESYIGCQNVLKSVMENPDPTIAVLALNSLYTMETKVRSFQFPTCRDDDDIRKFLRKWGSEALLNDYSGTYKRVPEILRALTIFKTLEIPLFIDDYGKKELLDNYGGNIQYILIDGSTPIYHVTHSEEAQKIIDERQLKPSANKNIIEGCWFGLSNSRSVYGSKCFKTTLSQLGVTGLHQGEIVSYRKEVNVILYAADDTEFFNLVKPTDGAVKAVKGYGAYPAVSIFVPSRFLPSHDRFWQVFSGPYEVEHGPFCVKEKRSGRASRFECKEVSLNE